MEAVALQVRSGILVYGMKEIISSTVICHILLWIHMKSVVVLHVCTCLTSRAIFSFSWSSNYCLFSRLNIGRGWIKLSLHILEFYALPFRFDTGGPGSCLKRYSDPTFFKRVSATSDEANSENLQRDRKARRSKVWAYTLKKRRMKF